MRHEEVLMLRLLDQALSLVCGVAQDVRTREVLVLPARGEVRRLAGPGAARLWLRDYAGCGVHRRQCFLRGCGCL